MSGTDSKGMIWSVRNKAGLTQADMARRMGMGISAYQDAETGVDAKPRHFLALERVSLSLAIEQGNIDLAMPTVRRDALDLARMITGG